MIEVFQTAIAAATSPFMIGFYLAGLCFFLGFLPALGARIITCSLSLDDRDED